MSENSFENSTYSENNSYDEASSNPPPESLHSPTNRVDDDFGSVGGATAAAAAATAGVYGSRLTSDLLTSLPVLSSTSSNSAQPYRTSYIKDAELSELLVRKQPKFVPQAPKCAKCAKNVYKAEEIRAANKTFHKLCFKCTACNKLLEPNILTEHAGDLFCKNCYAKNFGPKGYGVGLAMPATSPDASFSSPSPSSSSSSATSSPSLASPQAAVATSNSSASSSTSSLSNGSSSSSSASSSSALKWTFSSVPTSNGTKTTTTTAATISSACNHEKRMSHSGTNGGGPVVITTGEANKCARCTKPVYAAEKVNAAGKTYHKLCFNCASCKKMLSSMNCCDNSEGDVFCKSCYGRQYGPKGVGYGVSAGALQANS